MNITYRIDRDILYIALEGRIDASNAPEAEEQIFAIRNDNKDKHVVIDADQLTYISSAGLRLILKLRKDAPKLAIINVSTEIYEIFDLTGFTDMLTIEKAFPRISVEAASSSPRVPTVPYTATMTKPLSKPISPRMRCRTSSRSAKTPGAPLCWA